jgi:hypothetical protein
LPRYFFHLAGAVEVPDDEGSELADLEAAKCEAVQLIAQTLCDQPRSFWEADAYRVTTTDENGLILFTVEMIATLSAAMPPSRRS